jgi:hypothetical protein
VDSWRSPIREATNQRLDVERGQKERAHPLAVASKLLDAVFRLFVFIRRLLLSIRALARSVQRLFQTLENVNRFFTICKKIFQRP